MVVPAAPAAGEPIAEAWGDIVHEEVVALEFQTGTATVVVNNSDSVGMRVNFAHAFASTPIVVVTQAANTKGWIATTGAIDASGFNLMVSTKAGNAATANILCHFLAYGPRA